MKKMYTISDCHYSRMYAMVKKGQPNGWPFGIGNTYEECIHDAEKLLGELEEVEENLFTPKN